jgi:alpha-galactosidase
LRANAAEVTALWLPQPDSLFPSIADWHQAEPVMFCHDWQGRNLDPQRLTEVWLLWNRDAIFVRFQCRFRSIDVFSDAGPNGRRDELWNRDVAEVFLQPDRFGEKYYKEFEVSPNRMWLDLEITPQGLRHITSGMRSRINIDEQKRVWTAELAIPITALTACFDPARLWRVNFFRCEGLDPRRFYSSWQPTGTEKPNFHVPQKFGQLRFEGARL